MHTLLSPALFVLACSGCTGAGSKDDTGAGDTASGGDGVLADRCTAGFADTPEAWDVSLPLESDYFMYSLDGRGSYWSLADMNGDALPDIVVTAHGTGADSDKLASRWLLWENTGDGFAAQRDWLLPMDHRLLDGLDGVNTISQVMDITGDGVVDLVVAVDLETGAPWGAEGDPVWHVFPGDGSGFAAEPIAWSLPIADKVGLIQRYGRHVVKDIDGDGQVELVVTYAQGGDNLTAADGSPVWHVYDVDGNGFAEEPSAWPLPPAPYGSDAFPYWEGGTYDTYSVTDVTGDGRPDLVDSTTRDGVPHGEEGSHHWNVYPNTGAGFALTPTAWSVPHATLAYTGDRPEGDYPTAQSWWTFPVGGGQPHLVISHDYEADAGFIEDGAPIWSIFRSTGAGFEDQHAAWSIPDAAFDRLWSSGGSDTGGWHTLDIDGDGCFDLVHTAGLDLGEPASSTSPWTWHVYRGQ